jgi:carnitine O-acetyltransferase
MVPSADHLFCSQFWKVINEVATRATLDAPVGFFTCDHRDRWAEARQRLIDLSDVNLASLQEIESAILAVSLDDVAMRETVPAGDELASATASFQYGLANPVNRWLDKSLTLFIERDGRGGMNGEHSPCDALIPAIMAEETLRQPVEYFDAAPAEPSAANLEAPCALHFVLDDYLEEMLVETRRLVNEISADSHAVMVRFREYGANFIKKTAKVSPDAYMQMALQLTYYTIHKEVTAVYETASTRAYLKGRTETTRSLSKQSRAWCEAMRNPSVSTAERYRLFKEACNAHVEYLKIASKGYGCDRHMLGLRLVMREGEQHAVFTDPSFKLSQYWRLSTSGLSVGDLLIGTGFGAVVPDGYGINYQARPHALQFGVESKRSCEKTDSERFRNTLMACLREMGAMCEEANANDSSKAKL